MNVKQDEYDQLRLKLLNFLEELGPKQGKSMMPLLGAAYISALKTSGYSKDEVMKTLSDYTELLYNLGISEQE